MSARVYRGRSATISGLGPVELTLPARSHSPAAAEVHLPGSPATDFTRMNGRPMA